MTSSLKTAGVGDVLAERAAVRGHAATDRGGSRCASEQCQQPAGVVEVLHQVFAARLQVAEHRHLSLAAAKSSSESSRPKRGGPWQRDGSASWSSPTAPCRRPRRSRSSLGHDVCAAAGPPTPSRRCGGPRSRRHLRMRRVDRRNRTRAGQRTGRATSTSARHGRRGAHGVAGAGRSRRSFADLAPRFLVELARAIVGQRLPGARAGAQAAVRRASGRAASRRPARRSPGCSSTPRPSRARAWSCRSRRGAPRRRSGASAGSPRPPSRAGCGR